MLEVDCGSDEIDSRIGAPAVDEVQQHKLKGLIYMP